MRRRYRLIAILFALLDITSVSAQENPSDLEINIPETVWGFDGKVVRETFSPLSILVQNPGPKMLSSKLHLTRQMPIGPVVEPPIEIEFDVPPFEERWVQAAPYVLDEHIPWQITWGPREKQKVELPQARLGDPAIVLLANPNDRPKPSGALRRFRSNLFPISITFTDGLQAVFLDSVPDIQGARLQTFVEWLHRGGTVVLLHDDDHAYPKFPSALAMLNAPGDSFEVGSGRVRRLPMRARDVDDLQLRRTTAADGAGKMNKETVAAFADPYKTYNGRYPWNRDRKVLEKLEGVSQFHRRWWLIYPLALLYLFAVFPGSFVVARSTKTVRWFYAVYFSTAILFSLAFKTLGGVGGGDANRIRSATIARQLSPGVFDCSQWNCLAAVDGGWYALSHTGGGRLYASCEEFETPRGQVTTGGQAKFEVDIPVASTRTAIARFRATAPEFSVQLQATEFLDDKLAACTLNFGGLPQEPIEAFVCHGDSILRMQWKGRAWSTDRRRSMSTSVFISDLDRLPNYTMNVRGNVTREQALSKDFYRSLERVLVGNAFQIRELVDPKSALLPPGRLRVMALVEADNAFAGQTAGFHDVQGCVLYVLDLPTSGK
jgi:hypothetical protein